MSAHISSTSASELSTPATGSAITPTAMKRLNLEARALATTALLALLVAMISAFTLGYTPDQGHEITITSGDPALSKGQISRP